MDKMAIAACAASLALSSAAGNLTDRIAAKHPVKGADVWCGGQRTVFDFEGYDAWVVEPPEGTVAADGKPWTWTMQWRTAFVSRTGVPQLLKAAGGDIKVICRALYGHHPHGFEESDTTIADFFTGTTGR